MPRILDYGAPEVESQVPLEVSSRPIEEAGQMGHSLQQFGQQFTGLAEAKYQRDAQEEMSNAHVDGSITRANALAGLNKQIASGDVDTEKIMQDFDDNAQEKGDQYQTAHGKQTYDRQMALTRSMLLRQAVNAKAHLAGQQAVAKSQTALDADSNATFQDPSAFPSIYKAHMDGIDAQVGAGGIPAGISEKMKNDHAKNLAVGAVRGWMEINPDIAEKMLNGTGENGHKGAFDTYFDANTKYQMQGEIDAKRRHNDIQDERDQMMKDKAQKASGEAFYRQNFDAIHGDGDKPFRTTDIETAVRRGTIKPEMGEHLISMMKQADKAEAGTDWPAFNEMQKRVANNDVPDPQEYRSKYGSGFTKQNIQDLDYMYNTSDEGKMMNANRVAMFKQAESIRYKDPVTMQGYAPAGEAKFGKFKTDLIQAEIQQRKAKKPIADLYNPESPDYFGNRLNAYQTPLSQRYTENVQAMKTQAVAPKDPTKRPSLDDIMSGKVK